MPPPLIESIQRLPLKSVHVDGNRIVYVETGSGAPLILLHGFGGSIWNWEHQQLALAQHYRILTLDLLGSGQSAKPDIPYTTSHLVTFLLHFMDAVDIDHATLIGNSMGAGLAMAVALSAPDRVKALTLIAGFPQALEGAIHSPLYNRFLHHRPPLWLAQFANKLSGRWATRRVLEEILYDHSLLTAVVIERSFVNRHQRDILPPLYSLTDHLDEWEERYGPRLGEIQHPVLILWGEEDNVFSPTMAEDLARILPNARSHRIPQAGHLLQWEKPDEVNAQIISFLKTLNPHSST